MKWKERRRSQVFVTAPYMQRMNPTGYSYEPTDPYASIWLAILSLTLESKYNYCLRFVSVKEFTSIFVNCMGCSIASIFLQIRILLGIGGFF